MDNIQDRMKWYNDTFNQEECVVEKFDFVDLYQKILERFENKDIDFFLSQLKKECKCEDLTNCDCDTEDSFGVISKNIEVHSNCKTTLDINTNSKIKHQCRLFYLTKEDEEFPLIDIYKHHIIIHMNNKKIKFSNEDRVKVKGNKLHASFNYMSFDFL